MIANTSPSVGVPTRLLPMGDTAILVETSNIDAVLALSATLGQLAATRQGVWADVDDIVPAARTVLVVARGGTDLPALAEVIKRAGAQTTVSETVSDGGQVEIPVRYNGPDLEDVARHTGLTTREVVEAHTGMPWRVGFGGFAPGFAYLVGGDPRLTVPRRSSPRTAVPAGAVALAGDFSGIYPRESPGGWQLIGTTDAVLWDVQRTPPALFTPGMVVTFVEVSP